jgi:HEAT repeats/HEAT repeat
MGYALVWGTKRKLTKMGYVADFCPICRQSRPFSLFRVGMAFHIYLIPLGDGKLLGYLAKCHQCQVYLSANPNLYQVIGKKLSPDLRSLVEQTFPSLNQYYRDRLEVEKRINQNPRSLPADIRATLLEEPFSLLSFVVEAQMSSEKRFDLANDLGCIFGLLFPILALIIGLSFQWLLPIMLCWLIYMLIQTIFFNQKYLVREIVPLLGSCLKPLNPTLEELQVFLDRYPILKQRMGGQLTARQLSKIIETSQAIETSQMFETSQKPHQNPKTSKLPVQERDRVWFNTTDDRPNLPEELEPSGDSSIEDLIKKLGCGNNAEFRCLAAELLGQRGLTAAPAISALLIACVDINATVRTAALNALESIDPNWPKNSEVQKVFPKLVEEFKRSYCIKKSYSEEVSQAAYKLLEQIGEPAVSFLANLIVEEEDKIEYKIRAIWILRDIGLAAASAMPQLIQALSDKASKVRITAAETLLNFRPVAKVAIPKLIVGLGDRDVDVRRAMVACLVATEPAVPDLLQLLADKNPNVREAIADALIQIGPQTVSVLIETVSQWCIKPKADTDDFEKYQEITRAALQVLGKIGSDASVAMPTIALAFADPNPKIKFAAVQALSNIDRNWMSDPGVVDAILNLPEQKVNKAEQEMNKAEKSFGFQVPIESSDIANFAGKPKSEEIAVEIVLQTFTAIGAVAVPVLIDALEFGDRLTRQSAAKALGQIGEGAWAAISALTRALKDNDRLVRAEAAKALRKIDPSTPSPGLGGWIQYPDD